MQALGDAAQKERKRAVWRRGQLWGVRRKAKRASLHPATVTLLVFLHEAIPGGIEREARTIIQDAIVAIEDDLEPTKS